MTSKKDQLARKKAEHNKRIESKNRIARIAERDKRIERLYYANCSGSPMNALDICRVLQVGNRAITLNPEIPDAELATVIMDFVQTIRMNCRSPNIPGGEEVRPPGQPQFSTRG
jgi:hypothetical protein